MIVEDAWVVLVTRFAEGALDRRVEACIKRLTALLS
jgi:hypothetical protein